jgi:hypothetical protein
MPTGEFWGFAITSPFVRESQDVVRAFLKLSAKMGALSITALASMYGCMEMSKYSNLS